MANKTLDSIREGVEGLATLEILTLVGNFELTDDSKNIAPGSAANADKILSRIALVSGDVQTAMSPVFVTDPNYREIWTFHQQQVDNGHQIIAKNLEALKKLIAFIRDDIDKGGTTESA